MMPQASEPMIKFNPNLTNIKPQNLFTQTLNKACFTKL